jgi:hypothetical protein
MKVQAKFKVSAITKRQGWGGNAWVYDITLNPVVGDSEENKKFYSATPGGEIRLATVNESVANELQPGLEYYVTFDKA